MKSEKELNDFTKYVLKEADLKSPSSSFVDNVMNKIDKEVSINSQFVYKPLISKKGWFIIFATIILASLAVIKNTQTTNTFLPSWELSFLEDAVKYFQFKEIKISKTFVICAVVFSTLMMVQVLGIKHFYNKENSN
jgi:hypothetical protein